MINTNGNGAAKPGKVLSVLEDPAQVTQVGVVGSPSDTAEITLDILETAEASRLRGQMVYLVLPHDNRRIAILGQISRVETQNRWHEDISFRGIIKRQGALPHLSGRADVRTATLTVQAAFTIDNDDAGVEFCREDMLGTSPGTGYPAYLVRDDVLNSLLEKYQSELVYLGRIFGTEVKMPFTLRHFGKGIGGAGEAYHIGVFGKTGSGKSGLAAYLLYAYARHRDMGLLFIDPQGQFSSDKDLPFPLHRSLRGLGRQVQTFKLATQVRLREDAKAFAELLRKADFYRYIGIRNAENQELAAEVLYLCVRKALTAAGAKIDDAPADLMEKSLQVLVEDPKALEQIYTGKDRREQLALRLQGLLADPEDLQEARKRWQTALDFFQKTDSSGNERTPLWNIVASVIKNDTADSQPIVFLDISGEGTAFKDDEEIKAMLLKEIANALNVEGGNAFQEGRRLNCLVALDEAHCYVRSYARGDDTSEMAQLTAKFVDAVRTTRKYGLGYMFITQTLASLHREIIGQLRLCAFGYGLTMGSEMAQLEELVGDKEALSLYRSFVDPQSNKQFPFMFTGPASPLSFTGMPLFVQMFTSFADFAAANSWSPATRADGTPDIPFTTSRGFDTAEARQKAARADFD
ncbi:MAG: hypothetical protein OHK0029_40470 [Armatimonadaceae bacterium]